MGAGHPHLQLVVEVIFRFYPTKGSSPRLEYALPKAFLTLRRGAPAAAGAGQDASMGRGRSLGSISYSPMGIALTLRVRRGDLSHLDTLQEVEIARASEVIPPRRGARVRGGVRLRLRRRTTTREGRSAPREACGWKPRGCR